MAFRASRIIRQEVFTNPDKIGYGVYKYPPGTEWYKDKLSPLKYPKQKNPSKVRRLFFDTLTKLGINSEGVYSWAAYKPPGYTTGHESKGLFKDDLTVMTPIVLESIRRLPLDIRAARLRRLHVATDCSLKGIELPKEQWTKQEDDVPYLVWTKPIVVAEEVSRVSFRLENPTTASPLLTSIMNYVNK